MKTAALAMLTIASLLQQAPEGMVPIPAGEFGMGRTQDPRPERTKSSAAAVGPTTMNAIS
jgi:hypothetical protein